MWFTLKELLPDSTDFTEAIFKMPQISKHFSAMLTKNITDRLISDFKTIIHCVKFYKVQRTGNGKMPTMKRMSKIANVFVK